MSRYRVLRELAGCGPVTAGFIALLNWAFGVPRGWIVFGGIEIEYTDHD